MTAPLEDIDRLMEVMEEAFDPAFGEAWTRRQVADSLLVGANHYLLVNEAGTPAKPDEQVAGFYLSRTGYKEEELLLLAVSPAYRRRGLGRKLLGYVTAAAAKRGAQRIFLEMRRGNPAEALYRATGFQQIGERPQYYRGCDGNRIDALTFALDLYDSKDPLTDK